MLGLHKRWAKGLITFTAACMLTFNVCWSAASVSAAETSDVTSAANSNVLVETGGTINWTNPNISGAANQRIAWGIENYPAKKYALLFWNHGASSVNGFGADELFNRDSLLLPEMDSALRDAYRETGARFELIGFDACLMASVETASVLKKYANYLVVSEPLESGPGWNYTPILQHLANQPYIDGAVLGKMMADSYEAQTNDQQYEEEITLSVVDLRKVADIEEALDIIMLHRN